MYRWEQQAWAIWCNFLRPQNSLSTFSLLPHRGHLFYCLHAAESPRVTSAHINASLQHGVHIVGSPQRWQAVRPCERLTCTKYVIGSPGGRGLWIPSQHSTRSFGSVCPGSSVSTTGWSSARPTSKVDLSKMQALFVRGMYLPTLTRTSPWREWTQHVGVFRRTCPTVRL